MKWLNGILSLLLGTLILLSTSGFTYTRHTCLATGNIRLVLENDFGCCEEKSVSCCSEQESCCSKNIPQFEDSDEEGDCCINETHYLKNDDEFASPGKPELPEIKITLIFAYNFFNSGRSEVLRQDGRAYPPPGFSTSGLMLHQNCILLI